MWVHNTDDLNNIVCFLSQNYALSRDINIDGEFESIYVSEPVGKAFSGHFDGDGHTISNAHIISKTDQNDIGLFGIIGEHEHGHSRIENLRLENITVSGGDRIGALAGTAVYTYFSNITINNITINGNVIGGMAGTMEDSQIEEGTFYYSNVTLSPDADYKGVLSGAVRHPTKIPHYTLIGLGIQG